MTSAPGATRVDDLWRRVVGRVAAAHGTLKVRMTLVTVGSLGVAILVISMLALTRLEHGLVSQAQTRELTRTAHAASDLSRRVVSLQRALRATAERLEARVEGDDEAFARYLLDQPVLLESFANLAVVAPDGRIRVVVDRAGARQPQVSIADRAYFVQAVQERRPVVSEPTAGRISGEPVIVFCHPMVRDGRVTTVLAASIRLASRSLAAPLFEAADADTPSDLVILTDEAGRIVGHPESHRLLQPLASDARLADAAHEWVLKGSPAEPSGLVLQQHGTIVTAAGVSGTGLVLWRSTPTAPLLEPLRAARLQAAVDALAVVLILGAVTLVLVAWLLRPLKALETRARSMFDHGADVHAGWPRAGGEVGSLMSVLRHVGAERAHLETFTHQVLGRLTSVMAAAPLGIAFTRDGRFELVSAALCKLLQRTEAELLGSDLSAIFADVSDPDAMVDACARAFGSTGQYEGDWRLCRADGVVFWGRLCARPVDPADPSEGAIWTLADVTASRANQEQLEWLATHDALTGLANRSAFEARARAVFGHPPAALIMIDLDRFKPINDTHGHAAGDAMLRAVAAALASAVRTGDLVARVGGDEFAVVLARCPSEAAQRAADDLLEAITRADLHWSGHRLSVGASAGVASWAIGYGSLEAWMAAADQACYAAKAAGRATVRVARPEGARVIELPRQGAGR